MYCKNIKQIITGTFHFKQALGFKDSGDNFNAIIPTTSRLLRADEKSLLFLILLGAIGLFWLQNEIWDN